LVGQYEIYAEIAFSGHENAENEHKERLNKQYRTVKSSNICSRHVGMNSWLF